MDNRATTMAEVFKSIHGALNTKNLVRVKDLIDTDPNFIITEKNTKEYFKKCVEYLNVDEKDIYYDKDSMFDPIFYLKGCIYISLSSLNMEALKMLKMSEKIKFVTKHFNELIEKHTVIHQSLIQDFCFFEFL